MFNLDQVLENRVLCKQASKEVLSPRVLCKQVSKEVLSPILVPREGLFIKSHDLRAISFEMLRFSSDLVLYF